MSREILDCLKRERDICVQNVIYSQNTAFMFTPALKCPYLQNFYFLIRSYISCNEPCRKNFFHLDKKRSFYESLKTWKSYFLAAYPCRWSHDRHAQSCDVDSGTCDLRLDLFRVCYLCKFSFVDHAKCSFPAFCMNY